MKVLHLLATGEIGGIETLIKNYDEYSQNDNIYLFVWGGGVIADELKNRGRKTIILNKTNRQFMEVFQNVVQICKEEKIQTIVVHHESPLLKLLIVGLKIKLSWLPVIAYAHAHADIICNENKTKGIKIRKFIQRVGFLYADGVIAISNTVAESIKELLKVSEEKIQIIYNGIPLKHYKEFYAKETENTYRVTYVGRLSVEKGVQNIIDLFSMLGEEFQNRIELQIVGDGPYRKELEHRAKEKNLSMIKFLGNRTDVPEILGDSHFFVHFPACEEGFGIAVAEAMAAGNICICLKRGAIGEIIDHTVDGYLLNELDSVQLGMLLQKAMENYETEEFRCVRENAMKKAKSFSIEQFSQQFDEYIYTISNK